MSKKDGMMAICLQMPDRVPRTEYSADRHWDLVKAVTGLDGNYDIGIRKKASIAFKKAWNYDLVWTTGLDSSELQEFHTSMGHAAYAANSEDFNDQTGSYFHNEDEVLGFDAEEKLCCKSEEEIISFFDSIYDKRCEEYDDCVNTVGTYITAMSGMISLFGWNLLLTAAGVDPDGFGEVVNHYTNWMLRYYTALSKCKSDVIMVHDDIVWTSGAFLHPDWYRKYIFPNYKKLFKPLVESGKKILFTSDGDFTQFIDDIADCQINGFVLEPMTDMAYIADKYGKTHSFVGNVDTRVLLTGEKEDIEREVKRCMNIGLKCPGFFIAVGNHIPPNTPVDHALWYQEFYEKYGRR